jgi:hypothetical protein
MCGPDEKVMGYVGLPRGYIRERVRVCVCVFRICY